MTPSFTADVNAAQESTGSAAAGIPSRFVEHSEYDGRLRFLPCRKEYKDTTTFPASYFQTDSDGVNMYYCITQQILTNR